MIWITRTVESRFACRPLVEPSGETAFEQNHSRIAITQRAMTKTAKAGETVLQPVVNASRNSCQANAQPSNFPGLMRHGVNVLKTVDIFCFKREIHGFSYFEKTEPTPFRE